VWSASIAAWFVDRLRDVRVAEQDTKATLAEVLTELRAVCARLDALEQPERRAELAATGGPGAAHPPGGLT